MACTSAEKEEGKVFFFEKKKQKTFICLGLCLSGWAQPGRQRFFGSLFEQEQA
jgi:hypothetical protein